MTIQRMVVVVLVASATFAFGDARRPSPFTPPADVDYHSENIMSEGSRLSAEVFSPKSTGNAKLPTIILSHGWGGQASLLRPEAVAFAKAGYLAVTFDYRGWGSSDGRVVLASPPPETFSKAPFDAKVIEIREVVDPIDQTTDLLNAIHWVHGLANCDTNRIGLWGTSYSGGHVVFAAATDHRVKAIVSQVGSLDSRFVVASNEEATKTREEAVRRTHGELGYPEPGMRVIGNLKGAPIREKLMRYAPVEMVANAPRCAMLFIIAEKEELFDNKDHAIKAQELARGPKKLVTIPGITHYGVYLQARKRCQELAIEWFNEQLK